MKFEFDFRCYRLPFRAAVRTAHGTWPAREGVIIRLKNASAQVGYGEAAPVPGFGTETVSEIAAFCTGFGAVVDEERLTSVPERFACLRHALADARVGHEVSSAGSRGIAALLPAGSAALSVVPPQAEAGFRVFKWKVGLGDVTDELGLLDDVCAKLPSGAKLRLDANGAWDRRRAERWLERCAERPVEFVEQPVAADARGAKDLLLGLAADFPTPLALDESLVGEGDVERWIGMGWPGIFVVKPALFGDVPRALARLTAGKADVVFSSALETAVGARAALRAAFAWEGQPRALGFGVWPLFADARFDGPHLAPFIRGEDVDRIDPEAVWNALS